MLEMKEIAKSADDVWWGGDMTQHVRSGHQGLSVLEETKEMEKSGDDVWWVVT